MEGPPSSPPLSLWCWVFCWPWWWGGQDSRSQREEALYCRPSDCTGGVKQSYWGRRIARLGQEEGRVQPTQRETRYHGKDKQREASSWPASLFHSPHVPTPANIQHVVLTTQILSQHEIWGRQINHNVLNVAVMSAHMWVWVNTNLVELREANKDGAPELKYGLC